MPGTLPFTTRSVDEVERLLGDPGVVIVDVREPKELQATGTVPGAVPIPLGRLAAALDPAGPDHDPVFDGARTVVFYCAAGARSARAASAAAEAGLKKVVNMAGGFNAWSQAALPVEEPTEDDDA